MKQGTKMVHPHTGEPLTPVYVSPKTGRKFWPILGASEDDPTEEEKAAAKAAADASTAGDNDRTFTQTEVTEIMAREKKQGKRAGSSDAWKALGFESESEAKEFVENKRKDEEAAKTEQERKESKLAADRAQLEKDRADAAAERHTTRLERSLLRRSVKDDDLDDAMLLLSRGVEADDDSDAIGEAVDALKERRPELFDVAAPNEKERRTKANMPPGRPGDRKQPDGQVFGAKGLERARKRGFIKD